MKRNRFSEEQIIGILRQAKAGSPVKAVCAVAQYQRLRLTTRGEEIRRGWKGAKPGG
jgi:hypothetical protein